VPSNNPIFWAFNWTALRLKVNKRNSFFIRKKLRVILIEIGFIK
jgi:hypothetical protein